MTQPLALILYERLLPGTQLVNRLQDLKYRVQTLSDPKALVPCAQQEKPLVVLADAAPATDAVLAAVEQLRKNADTGHVPVVAFGPEEGPAWQEAARAAGATLVASDTAVLNHLPQLLQEALRVE